MFWCEYVTVYLRPLSCGVAWLSSPLLLWNLDVSVYHEHGRCEHAYIGFSVDLFELSWPRRGLAGLHGFDIFALFC